MPTPSELLSFAVNQESGRKAWDRERKADLSGDINIGRQMLDADLVIDLLTISSPSRSMESATTSKSALPSCAWRWSSVGISFRQE